MHSPRGASQESGAGRMAARELCSTSVVPRHVWVLPMILAKDHGPALAP